MVAPSQSLPAGLYTSTRLSKTWRISGEPGAKYEHLDRPVLSGEVRGKASRDNRRHAYMGAVAVTKMEQTFKPAEKDAATGKHFRVTPAINTPGECVSLLLAIIDPHSVLNREPP